MKYLVILMMVVLVGCATEQTDKYPQCLKFPPNPKVPYEELIKYPTYSKPLCEGGMIANMQWINVDYPTREIEYLEMMYRNKLIKKSAYTWCKANYKYYMPRKVK